uniref:Testis expressed 264, ER-phagy receptor n=1 Tax=Leptobrachium leishanense TaxID=445787 RepID=A0A8C5PZS1_9ANUR
MSSVPEWVLLSLIAALIALLLLTLFGVAVYSGLLTEVEVRAGPPPIRGVVVAYKFRVGPYDESGNLYTENVSLAPKLVSIGVYYDNPMKVPVEFCRYMVGTILCEGDEKPLPDHVRIFRKHGFKFWVLPEVNHAVMATFPYTTPFSIQLATTRVHPALEKYVKVKLIPELLPRHTHGLAPSHTLIKNLHKSRFWV